MSATVIDAPGLDEPGRRGATRPAPALPRNRLGRFVRGRPSDPGWVRPVLLALLVGTGFLYLWDLGASGWANSFYSAAVQAGTRSWKAFFFGSFDSSSFITVDKSPAALWVMELSARMFGVNAWSILVPNALEGVATVAGAVRHCAPLVRARGCSAGGRPGGLDAGRRFDVPLQQPRCVHGPPAYGGRLRSGAGG